MYNNKKLSNMFKEKDKECIEVYLNKRKELSEIDNKKIDCKIICKQSGYRLIKK